MLQRALFKTRPDPEAAQALTSAGSRGPSALVLPPLLAPSLGSPQSFSPTLFWRYGPRGCSRLKLLSSWTWQRGIVPLMACGNSLAAKPCQKLADHEHGLRRARALSSPALVHFWSTETSNMRSSSRPSRFTIRSGNAASTCLQFWPWPAGMPACQKPPGPLQQSPAHPGGRPAAGPHVSQSSLKPPKACSHRHAWSLVGCSGQS